jgi:FlaA1/EpsC-like NDP-sugar epimerase
MYEELFNTAEDHIPTAHERIHAALCACVDPDALEAAVTGIKVLIDQKDVAGLIRLFERLVPGYRPCLRLNALGVEGIQEKPALMN